VGADAREADQPAGRSEQRSRDRDRRLAFGSGAEQNREQVDVTQRFRARVESTLAQVERSLDRNNLVR
jgi:hypothetical protein